MSDPFGSGGGPTNPWGAPPPADPAQGQGGDTYPSSSPQVPPYQGLQSQSGAGYQGPQSQSGQFGQAGQPNQSGPFAPQGQTAAPSQPAWNGPTAPYQPAPSQPLYPANDPTIQSPFGQPAAPSGFGQPGVPSPFGQPAAPSQPMLGPGQMTLPPAGFGQFGPPSAGFGGRSPAPAAPRRSRKGLWIGLAIVAVLLVVSGVGAIVGIGMYKAPADAATAFCGALKAQNYETAYGMLSSAMQRQYTKDQFTLGSKALDTAEGPVTACTQATSNAYSYSLGASTATVRAVLTRGKQGSLTGALHLTSEGGAWKVDAIDTSLLGVNLDALKTAMAFCAAMQGKDYATAYNLVGSSLTGGSGSQSDLATAAGLWDGIEGPITGCALTSLGSGNTDTSATLDVSLTRSKASHSGQLTLTKQGNTWKITQIDETLLGPDLGPLVTGITWCTAIQAGQYSTAWALITSDYQQYYGSLDTFKQAWGPASDGLTVAGCDQPKLDTYKVSGSSASYDVGIIVERLSDQAKQTQLVTFQFVKEGDAWKLDAVSDESSS